MGKVVSYFDHKRRAKSGRTRHIDPVIAEILEALLVLGGSAHRQAVADRITLRRSGRTCPSDAEARNEVYATFDAYLAWAATRNAPPLLCLPLGRASYRWALTDAGLSLLQPVPPVACMVN